MQIHRQLEYSGKQNQNKVLLRNLAGRERLGFPSSALKEISLDFLWPETKTLTILTTNSIYWFKSVRSRQEGCGSRDHLTSWAFPHRQIQENEPQIHLGWENPQAQPWTQHCHQPISPNPSRDGDTTTLGRLFQCLTAFLVKKFLQILNLSWHNLRPRGENSFGAAAFVQKETRSAGTWRRFNWKTEYSMRIKK